MGCMPTHSMMGKVEVCSIRKVLQLVLIADGEVAHEFRL